MHPRRKLKLIKKFRRIRDFAKKETEPEGLYILARSLPGCRNVTIEIPLPRNQVTVWMLDCCYVGRHYDFCEAFRMAINSAVITETSKIINGEYIN